VASLDSGEGWSPPGVFLVVDSDTVSPALPLPLSNGGTSSETATGPSLALPSGGEEGCFASLDAGAFDAAPKTETVSLSLSASFASLGKPKADVTLDFSGSVSPSPALFNNSPNDFCGLEWAPNALPLVPIYAANPPLVDATVGFSETDVVEVNGDLAIPMAETEPKDGFWLPRADGVPNVGVVDPDLGGVETDAKADTGLFCGGL
jgi:hypothetical protein